MTEAILNGGFEAGNGSGIGWSEDVNIVNTQHYTGLYALFIYSSYVSQTDDFSVLVSLISSFGFYYKNNTDASVRIIYSDGYTDVDIPTGASTWTLLDLKPYLVNGKTVINIRFHGGSGSPSYIDDVSLIYTPPPSIEVETLPETSRTSSTVVLWGEASGTSGVHLSLLGFQYRLIGEDDWIEIYVPADQVTPWQFSLQIGGLYPYAGYEYRARMYCDDEENYPELVGWYYGDTRSFDTIEAESDVGIVIIRPYSIVLGPYDNGTSTYEWFGIRTIKWGDVTPWVHTDIPSGPMLHQHLRSPHVTGEIVVIDLDKLHTALFTTVVNDTFSKPAIDINNNNKKYPVTYCMFRFVDQNKDIVEYSVSKFRVETVSVDLVELGHETRYIVRFSADLIKKEA